MGSVILTQIFLSQTKSSNEIIIINETEYHNEIYEELANQNTNRSFSPTDAPQFNGLAKAAIKSVKLHLKRTIGFQMVRPSMFNAEL